MLVLQIKEYITQIFEFHPLQAQKNIFSFGFKKKMRKKTCDPFFLLSNLAHKDNFKTHFQVLKDHIDNCKLNEVFQRTKLLQPSKSHIKTK